MPARASYRTIARDLEDRIRSGEYPAGSRLPSYAELAKLYSVSVTTVQGAIRLLRERRLVEGDPGRGVFVVDQTSGT